MHQLKNKISTTWRRL